MSTETMSGTPGNKHTEQIPMAVPTIIAAANITAEQVQKWGRLLGTATRKRTMAFMEGGMLTFGYTTMLIDHNDQKNPERKLQSAYVISPVNKDGPDRFTLVVPQTYLTNDRDSRGFTKFIADGSSLKEIPTSVREETNPLVLEALSRSESDLRGKPDQDEYFDEQPVRPSRKRNIAG